MNKMASAIQQSSNKWKWNQESNEHKQNEKDEAEKTREENQ